MFNDQFNVPLEEGGFTLYTAAHTTTPGWNQYLA